MERLEYIQAVEESLGYAIESSSKDEAFVYSQCDEGMEDAEYTASLIRVPVRLVRTGP